MRRSSTDWTEVGKGFDQGATKSATPYTTTTDSVSLRPLPWCLSRDTKSNHKVILGYNPLGVWFNFDFDYSRTFCFLFHYGHAKSRKYNFIRG